MAKLSVGLKSVVYNQLSVEDGEKSGDDSSADLSESESEVESNMTVQEQETSITSIMQGIRGNLINSKKKKERTHTTSPTNLDSKKSKTSENNPKSK